MDRRASSSRRAAAPLSSGEAGGATSLSPPAPPRARVPAPPLPPPPICLPAALCARHDAYVLREEDFLTVEELETCRRPVGLPPRSVGDHAPVLTQHAPTECRSDSEARRPRGRHRQKTRGPCRGCAEGGRKTRQTTASTGRNDNLNRVLCGLHIQSNRDRRQHTSRMHSLSDTSAAARGAAVRALVPSTTACPTTTLRIQPASTAAAAGRTRSRRREQHRRGRRTGAAAAETTRRGAEWQAA